MSCVKDLLNVDPIRSKMGIALLTICKRVYRVIWETGGTMRLLLRSAMRVRLQDCWVKNIHHNYHHETGEPRENRGEFQQTITQNYFIKTSIFIVEYVES